MESISVVFNDKGYSACSLNHKGVKKSNASKRPGPIPDHCIVGLLIPALVSPNFTICCMMCLHSFLFSVISDKGYFVVWGGLGFKAFHASFC